MAERAPRRGAARLRTYDTGWPPISGARRRWASYCVRLRRHGHRAPDTVGLSTPSRRGRTEPCRALRSASTTWRRGLPTAHSDCYKSTQSVWRGALNARPRSPALFATGAASATARHTAAARFLRSSCNQVAANNLHCLHCPTPCIERNGNQPPAAPPPRRRGSGSSAAAAPPRPRQTRRTQESAVNRVTSSSRSAPETPVSLSLLLFYLLHLLRQSACSDCRLVCAMPWRWRRLPAVRWPHPCAARCESGSGRETGCSNAAAGTSCSRLNEWFWQCLPGAAVAGGASSGEAPQCNCMATSASRNAAAEVHHPAPRGSTRAAH
jgi:hypothetical protein